MSKPKRHCNRCGWPMKKHEHVCPKCKHDQLWPCHEADERQLKIEIKAL